MMETLFGYTNTDKSKSQAKKRSASMEQAPQFIQIIDSKKAQNLSILLRALNVTMEEVCDALREGKVIHGSTKNMITIECVRFYLYKESFVTSVRMIRK